MNTRWRRSKGRRGSRAVARFGMAVTRAMVGLRPLADQFVLLASPTGDASIPAAGSDPLISQSARQWKAQRWRGLFGLVTGLVTSRTPPHRRQAGPPGACEKPRHRP